MIRIVNSRSGQPEFYHASDVASIKGKAKSKDYPETKTLVEFYEGGYLYSSDKAETIARRVAQALGRKKGEADDN